MIIIYGDFSTIIITDIERSFHHVDNYCARILWAYNRSADDIAFSNLILSCSCVQYKGEILNVRRRDDGKEVNG